LAIGFESLSRAASGLFTPPLRRSYRRSTLIPDTWFVRLLLLALLAFMVAAPYLSDYYKLAIAIAIGIGVIGAVATNLLVGIAGQASIGNAAFMAIGAFAAAQFGGYYQWPFLASLAMSGLAAGVVGMFVAIPAMRIRGLYLIIATLALHYVAIFALTKFQASRVGDSGFLMPTVKVLDFTNVQTWYFLITFAAVLSVIIMRNLMRTRFGRAWAFIARDETGASVLGVRVRREKVLVFFFTSIMIGVQGGLFAYYVGVVNIDPFTFDLAVTFIAMIVIGGLGSSAGTILGAFFVVGLPYALTSLAQTLPTEMAAVLTSRLFDLETVVYGAAIVLFLVYQRRGLIYAWQRVAAGFNTWPLARPVKLTDD
jgi:branched-chain amino acid transport system permease protein